jgi:hypothetical protein
MKLARIYVSLGVFCAFINSAHSSDWQKTGTNTGSVILMDVESVIASGQYRKAWFNTVFNDAQTIPGSGYPMKIFFSERSLSYFNCEQKTFGNVQAIKYDFNRQIVESVAVAFDSEKMTDVIPDSTGEGMLQHACRIKLPVKSKG